MLNLLRNEWMKLWSKKSAWVMVILLATIIIGFTGLGKLSQNLFDDEEWISMMEEEIVEIDKQLTSPDLDEDERVYLETERGYRLESIQSYQPQTRETLIVGTFGIMSLVTLLTIIVAGGIVSSEFTDGTIKMLLSRPVSRWKILLSKYITVILFALLATVITYVASVLGAFLFYESGPGETFLFYGSEVAISDVWGKSLYLMLLSFVNVVVMSTIAFMLGTIFSSTSLAIGISIFLYFTGGIIVGFLSEYSFAKVILFAHSNLTNYETGYLMFSDLTMPFSIGVIIVHVALFLALSFAFFTKRDVTA